MADSTGSGDTLRKVGVEQLPGAATGDPTAIRHPLDPLTPDEVRRTTTILRRDRGLDARWRFASIELKEPSKGTVEGFSPGDPISREARVVCWNREDGQAYKAVVSLTEDRAVAWEHNPGEQPNITADEFHKCDVALRADPRVVEALAARGITNLDKVLFDVWAYGGSLIADRYRGMRIGWTDIWYRDHEDSNPYANPVIGLKLVVDLNRMELLEIEDTFRMEKPDVMGEYLPKYVPMPMREEPEPLEITQPEGTSFVLDGNEIRWQKWSLRVGFTVDTVSYWLKPAGFFDRNPALDVPPTSNGHRHNAHDTPRQG